jgi:type II secretory pathway pseudopilin PulG
VEIMLVVGIIAMLASIAMPSWLRSRKRAQAARIHAELQVIESALAQYAVETNKQAGFVPTFDDLKNYIKTNSLLYSSGGNDFFGNPYGPFTIDAIPKVPPATFNALSDVADGTFWGPYH